MTKVFFCKDTGERNFTQSWWCDTCHKPALELVVKRGVEADDPGYPKVTPDPVPCPTCHKPAVFSSSGSSVIFIRTDTGEEVTNLYKQPGACWAKARIMDRRTRTWRTGPDGRCLTVICPGGGSWEIDERCSNCDKPDDIDHKCWCRHGSPEDGTLTVDKVGLTCNAGAGSIITHNWHGFLRSGEFVPC